jgi:aspartate aminotransferase
MSSLSRIEGSPSLEVVNLVLDKLSRGEKVLSLAIGDPSSDTPREIVDAAYSSMLAGDVHYVPGYGTREVREAIRRKVLRSNAIRASMDDTIFLTTKLSVYVSLLSIAEPGYEVLVPNPGYFYSEPVILTGGQPVPYLLARDFSLDVEEIKRKTTVKTKGIIVNSPSNPTGKVHGKNELEELYHFCQEKKIYIISDEAYEDLTYGGIHHFAIGSLETTPEIVISLFSLSKSYSMTGWRAGYAIAPKTIAHLMNKFLENALTCFPPFIQHASAYALNEGEEFIEEFRKEYAEKRKIVLEIVNQIPSLECNAIEGAFYAFPRLRGSKVSSTEFAKKLLNSEGVAVLPGNAFGSGGEGRIRISFSGKRENLTLGLEKLQHFCSSE